MEKEEDPLMTWKHRIPATIAAVVLAATVSAPVEAQPYEPLPVLKASDFLEARFLKGPNHEVEERVVSDGIFNTYTIQSPFATFQPQGTSLAMIRIHEIGAIAQLEEVDKMAVAAGAAVDSMVNMGTGAVHLITNPVETAEGFGSGVSRLFGRIGRSAKRTQETLGSDGGTANDGTPPPSTGAKVADASGNFAKDLLGVNRAVRSWAQKLGVDPYTTNPVLLNELQDVAHYDAGGRFSTKLLPLGIVGTVLGTASTVNSLVWTKGPDELRTLNETRLQAMGVAPEDSRAFLQNKQYNLTLQTRLLASLDTLSEITGRPEFVARAAGAEARVDARFYQESAYMAETFHRTESPLIGIVPDLPGACVISRDDRFACLYPLDYLVWTEGVAEYANRITQHAESKFPKAKRELWLTGRASPHAGNELKERGWIVHERSMSVLPVVPVKPAAESK